MIYNNIILFMVALLLMTITKAPASPLLPTSWTIILLPLSGLIYWFICGKIFSRCRHRGSTIYFSTELLLSYLALSFFVASLHIFSIKFYLTPMTFHGTFPITEDLGCLLLFLCFLSIMWLRAKPYYEQIFHRSSSAALFVLSNIKVNLPLLFPWLFLTMAFDVLRLLPYPRFQTFLLSTWGDLLTYSLFVFFIIIFFPPLIKRFWSCRPLPEGPIRERISSFCRNHGFHSEILLWPLFEGQALTAGIVGLVPKFRYLMITPALLSTMDEDEIDSILAHEIAHVKRKHLLLYLCLFISFSLTAGAGSMLVNGLILNADLFYIILDRIDIDPETLRNTFYGAFIISTFLIFIRFIFAFFMRNFERQADAHVFEAIGSSAPLISAFEKIALLSGNIRNKKCWHHYGIGERIDFLTDCDKEPQLINRHSNNLKKYLGVYFLITIISATVLYNANSNTYFEKNYLRYMERVLIHKIRHHPHTANYFSIYAGILLENKQESKALEIYTEALKLSPNDPNMLNNTAWLLLTAQNKTLRDPKKGLILAQKAVNNKEEGFILDTLAVAFMENHMIDEAIYTEQKALELDPINSEYYLSQLTFFQAKKNGVAGNSPATPLSNLPINEGIEKRNNNP
ncbi:MAG: M48 family metalloprotease [Desulfobulbaceae bacterium]|nr:M48 family metalloprotease [Desulfobulbaceae bacterium]